MAVVYIGFYFTVTRAPDLFGFRIQPDNAAAPFPHLSQNGIFRMHIVGTAVTDDDQGCLLCQKIHIVPLEMTQCNSIIRGSVIMNIRLFQHKPDGLAVSYTHLT